MRTDSSPCHIERPMIRLTRKQVREIDRRSIEEFHIPGIVLMENAARAAAAVAMEMAKDYKSAVIVCGGGKNGAPSGSAIVAFALP